MLNKHEIFVDCGGYIGDSTLELLTKGGGKKIYFYEPNDVNMNEAKQNLNKYDNIVFRNVCVGRDNKKALFNGITLDSGGRILQEHDSKFQETIMTNIVRIDDDIDEKITFIKMDIEGSEMDALVGAAKHIAHDRPVLAICLYHKPEDMYEIPLYIDSLVSYYQYYVRHYTPYHGETVFYAVPSERIK